MPKVAQLERDEQPVPPRSAPRRAPTPKTRYFAFLSYSHKDEEEADWLHRELERFHVPNTLSGRLMEHGVIPRRLRPIFRDRHELAAADDLSEEIDEALASSQFLIVLCSPDAARSRWTNAEIRAFKRTRPEACVLAAIMSGEPFASDIPGREHEECFPPALRNRYDRRGRPTGKRAEPLAADLRDGGDGRRLGFLKLVAGLLGVGLDDLVQRDTVRRHRRMGWVAAASLAGMAVTSGLAISAIQSRDAARDQRREAEGLVAFMLGDLKDKLEPIGRLDALDGVGSRVLGYYSKQDASELSDAGLLQRARALSLTAQVAYLRGNYDNATRLYREALAGTAEAVRRSPDDAQRIFDHAQNTFWMGDLARRRGQIGQAEAAYREYRRLADRMVALDPNNLKWRMEVQYARENLGIVLMNQRRFDEAARQFQGMIGPMQSLASVDAGNADYQSELSNGLGWLADAQKALGQFDAAIGVRERQVALLDRLIAGGASGVTFQQQLIPAHQALGVLFTWQGEEQRAIDEFRVALNQASRLIAVEPGNSYWKDMTASVRLELGKALLTLGQNQEAAEQVAAGCSAAAALHAQDPTVARWRGLRTTCLAARSRLALASGSERDALALAKQAIASARAERSGDPAADRYKLASMYRLAGDAHARLGDSKDAAAAWLAGIRQLPQNMTESPSEMNERAELLKRLGRRAEAKPIAARLAAMGFKSAT